MKRGTFETLRRDVINQLDDALTNMRVAFGDVFILLACTEPTHNAVDFDELAGALYRISDDVNELINELDRLDLTEEESECETIAEEVTGK